MATPRLTRLLGLTWLAWLAWLTWLTELLRRTGLAELLRRTGLTGLLRLAGLLGLLGRPRTMPDDDLLAAAEPARWVLEVVVELVDRSIRTGSALRLADTVGPG